MRHRNNTVEIYNLTPTQIKLQRSLISTTLTPHWNKFQDVCKLYNQYIAWEENELNHCAKAPITFHPLPHLKLLLNHEGGWFYSFTTTINFIAENYKSINDVLLVSTSMSVLEKELKDIVTNTIDNINIVQKNILKIKDGTLRNTLYTDVFGKSWVEYILIDPDTKQCFSTRPNCINM